MDFILLLWFACGLVAAAIGAKKGEGCLALIAGLIFGPLGILATVFSKGNRKECPFCRERVHRAASVCPHCQRDLAKGI